MTEIKNITKKKGDRLLINDLSLSFEGKGVFGLLVTDNEEKCAISAIMSGTEWNFDGDISVNGEIYSSVDSEHKHIELRRRIGYVPENICFYGGMTLYELFWFVGEAKKISAQLLERQIKEAMELTGISDVKNVIFSNVSASVKKRTALGMALLGNPDIIIIEEPFASEKDEDFEAIKDIIAMLGKIKQVIIITGIAKIAEKLCSEIALVSAGQLMVQDNIEAINEKINTTRTLMLRLVSKKGCGAEDARALLEDLDGVFDIVIKSSSASGEMNIKCECDREIVANGCVEDTLLRNDYIILSSEIINVSLSDICAVLTKKGVGEK